jgi:hypothetical protein
MPDSVDSLLIDVRANTQGFAADVAAMRSTFDGTLVDGFERAGQALERGLLSALRKGSIGFEDLRKIAFSVIDSIASQALNNLFGSLGGGSGGGGSGGLLNLGTAIASIFGPGALPADRFRPDAAIWSASADPSCSCRPAPDGLKPASPAGRATSASRSISPPRRAAARRKRCNARAARSRARYAGH